MKARAARRRPRGRDARCARRRFRLGSANADDGNCRDDGLAPVGKYTGVHDGAGRRRFSIGACGACASARGCDGAGSAADGGDDDEANAVGARDDFATCEGG